ncbi:MAG: AAA family ATPase [Bradymonadaceae bacterium]
MDRIELQNFCGHRDTEIDLSDIECATVCGPNGAGKSTLLAYGPLYALYGAKQGDTYSDIVRHGAERAKVAVDFELGGDTYRVVRSYSMRTKAGKSTLDFARLEGGDFEPVETGTVTEVESAIQKTLGVDFDTMVTGTIQTQGEAGRFAEATSSERIEILSELLRVDYLKDGFTEAGRIRDRIESDIEDLDDRIEELQKKRERVETLNAEISALEDDLEGLADPVDTDNLESEIEDLEGTLDDLRSEIGRLDDIRDRRDDATSKIEDLRETLSDLREDYATVESRLESLDVEPPSVDPDILQARRDNIEDRVQEATKATERISDLRDEQTKLRGRIEDLKERRESIPEIIEQKTEKLRERADELGVDVGDVTSPEDWDVAISVVDDRITSLEDTWATIQDEKNRIVKQSDRLEQKWNHREERIEELEDRVAAIDQRNPEVPESKCQDCGLLESAFEAQEMLEDLRDTSDLEAEVEELKDAESTLEDFQEKRDLHSTGDFRRRRKEIQERLDQTKAAKRTASEIVDLRTEAIETMNDIDNLETKIAEYEQEVIEILHRWGVELESEKNPKDVAGERLERIEGELEARKLADRLEDIESKASEIKSDISDLEDTRAEFDDELADLGDLKDKRDTVVESLKDKRSDLQSARNKNEKIESRRSEIERKLAEKSGAVEQITEDLDDKGDLEEKRNQLQDRLDRLQYARRFFNVAPNLAIGRAIPRIEVEANDVLSDIFPGVQIEVDRRKTNKDGSTSDKLRLRVTRSGIEQHFDAFSGGEQFLLNIAIRLGLARAASIESAGHPLDLLVVDEGFGALDPNNVGRVQDALLELSDRFSQVLVISHVEDVANTFGTVIEVAPKDSKGAGGTEVVVR